MQCSLNQGCDHNLSRKTNSPLKSTSRFQQSRELSLLSLELGVAANVLLVDKDVRDGALVGNLLESSLEVGTVIWEKLVNVPAG